MFRIAVCDDNKITLDYLDQLISHIFSEQNMEYKVIPFQRGVDFVAANDEIPFDIVFLDIVMPDVSGFEVAKLIRKQSSKTYIVFITTESGLVYDSFDFQPFNFIPKGNHEILMPKLSNVIIKLIDNIGRNRPICFECAYGEKKYIEPNKIIFISSKSNYLDVKCEDQTFSIRGKIGDILKILPEKSFVRVHNRHIINMMHYCKIDNSSSKILMDNLMYVDVSRAYKSDFIKKYNLFLRDFN